jgi:two-component system chemotaxis response regulator CheB
MIVCRGTGGFPVVCVGGSAGGLDAHTQVLRHLPANIGVAVAVQHHGRGWYDECTA